MNLNSQSDQSKSLVQAKRILYVKNIVRLFRLCGSKYQQLLSHKDGRKSFHCSVLQLINQIDSTAATHSENGQPDETELINLTIEIIGSLQFSDGFTSKLVHCQRVDGVWFSK